MTRKTNQSVAMRHFTEGSGFMVSNEKSPRETWADRLMDVIEVAGTLHPFAAPAAVLISKFFGRPVERRRIEFLERLVERLKIAEERIGSLADLADRPEFVSALMKAIDVADRTHESEKLESLRNAVVNVAARAVAIETKAQSFLCCIDDFTVAHIIALRVFSSAIELRSMHRYSRVTEAIANRVLNSPKDEELAKMICLDLERRGLLSPILTPSISLPPSNLVDDHTTALGREFLRFIAATDIF